MAIPNAKLKTSDNAIKLIKEFEKCSLKAYLCPSKKWTIGWGHTGPDVQPGMVITQEQADHLLRVDLMKAENAVKAYVEAPLSQQQFDALVSFVFNTGRGNFVNGSVPAYANSPLLHDRVPDRIRLYNKGGEPPKLVVLPGLCRRREWEVNLWNTGKVFGPMDWPAQPGRVKYL